MTSNARSWEERPTNRNCPVHIVSTIIMISLLFSQIKCLWLIRFRCHCVLNWSCFVQHKRASNFWSFTLFLCHNYSIFNRNYCRVFISSTRHLRYPCLDKLFFSFETTSIMIASSIFWCTIFIFYKYGLFTFWNAESITDFVPTSLRNRYLDCFVWTMLSCQNQLLSLIKVAF